MNIKDDEYINSFDIKNVEDIDQVIDFMKGKKSLATWKEAIKKISEIDSYIDTIAKDRRPYIPKDVVWVTILEQYLSKIEKCYELIQKNCNYAGNRTELIGLSNTIAQSKYWAYCIYEEKKKLNIKLKDKIKNENKKENNINLYIALAEFWSAYNRDFDDYRRAIDMLCKNYPGNYQDMEDEEKNKIKKAFFDNVIYCGDKGDYGYCYQGINTMRANMNCLDDKLLENIILLYKGDDIARFSQYRHQIFTMIECIGEETIKKKLIDNILYGTVVLNIILTVLTAEGCDLYYNIWTCNSIKNYNNNYNRSETGHEILIKYENAWEIRTKTGWVYKIKIDSSNKKLLICVSNGKIEEEKQIPFEVNKFEWRLNDFIDNNKFRNEIKEALLDKKFNNRENLLFSYLYLNGYRGIRSCHFSFNHKFIYDSDKCEIYENNNEYFDTEGFYDRKIKSVSCIVGKNGAGKTSIIEFLGKTFSKILSLYDNDKEIDYAQIVENLKLDKGIEFLVIFQYGSKYYRVSNIENIYDSSKKTKEYKRSLLLQNGQKNKVYFWSNKLELREIFPVMHNLPDENNEYNEDNKEKSNYRDTKAYDVIAQIEYTRINDVREAQYLHSVRRTDENQSLNMLLIYQFMYIKFLFENSKGITELKQLEWEHVNLYEALIDKEKYKEIEDAISKNFNNLQDYTLFYDINVSWFKMSSGQEAKFTFEAKLYWALIGGKRFREYYSDILEKNSEQIDLSRCIREDDSAIIYIDEGDLYYHPEWQRQFMKSILDIVKLRKEECSLQLIITSNSPYILSDFFHQDVLYIMTDDEEFNIVETIGQNIHTLLKSPFFMKSTIGCVAYSKISEVMKALSYEGDSTSENKELPESIMEVLYNKRDDNLSKTELYNILKSFVNNIGEEIYKIELEHLLEEFLPEQNEFDILMKQKAEIEERLRFLQESK